MTTETDAIEPGTNGLAWTTYVRQIRTSLELTQKAMASHLGMSLRAYSDIETGVSECRLIHLLAAERVALRVAKLRESPNLVPPSVRHDAVIFRRAGTPARQSSGGQEDAEASPDDGDAGSA